jgi:hypothetical protein
MRATEGTCGARRSVMMPPVPPSLHSLVLSIGRRHRRVFVGFLVGAFALAGTNVARADFAPPTPAGDQRTGVDATTPSAGPVAAGTTTAPIEAAPAAVSASPAGPAPTAAVPEKPASAAPAAASSAVPAPAATMPSGAPRPAAVSEVDEEESLRAFADENPTPRTKLNVAAWIGTGVTVALLGVAAFYGAKAGEKASDVNRLSHNFDPTTDLPVEYSTVADQYTSAMRDGKHDARVAKGLAIAAGATALTSVALFIIDAVRRPDTDGGARNHALLTPLVTAQSAGLGLGGTF